MNIYAPAMYPSHWYNGDKGNNEMYISDMSSVLIGMPRIRQLRIERSKRGVKHYILLSLLCIPLLIGYFERNELVFPFCVCLDFSTSMKKFSYEIDFSHN